MTMTVNGYEIKPGSNLTYAELSGAELSGADLSGADLSGADLSGANLRYVNLHGADLDHADLTRADLRNAYLTRGNLHGAKMRCVRLVDADLAGACLGTADLTGANLDRADLAGANLSRATLTDVTLRGTTLRGVDVTCAVLGEGAVREQLRLAVSIVPETGAFTAFKKVVTEDQGGWNYGYAVAKLSVPASARRSSASGRKCRVSRAKVISITNPSDGQPVQGAVSIHDPGFAYIVGKFVSVPDFNEDWTNECTSGIHCFITEAEARNYWG